MELVVKLLFWVINIVAVLDMSKKIKELNVGG